MKNRSVEFAWDLKGYDKLVASCEFDDGVVNSLPWIKTKKSKILEAGCGTGRVIKYLTNKGYTNVFGIELNKTVVKQLKKMFPEMNIVAGDLLKMPYAINSMDVVLCYGVVEHFPTLGLIKPLESIRAVLKNGGVAIVTIPSFNFLRRAIYFIEDIKCVLKGTFFSYKKSRSNYLFNVFPRSGDFFEYRLTPSEFIKQCKLSGFEVIKSFPISHLDGLYHIFGNRYVKYEDYKFYPSFMGKIMNNLFIQIPYFHNHMQCCILKKLN